MPLKALLPSQAEVDALPEAVRGFYRADGDKFILDIDGAPVGFASPHDVLALKTQLAEFRDNNRTMHGELEALRPLKEKFADLDPDEYRRMKTEQDKLGKKGIKDVDGIDDLVRRSVESAMKPMTESLSNERKAREEAQGRADRADFSRIVSERATKAGVRAASVRMVLREAEEKFELRDGEIVPKAGVKHPHDPLKELTPVEWLSDLAKSDDYLFEPTTGAGAPSRGGSVTRANVRTLINPTPEEKGRHMDAIAKGDVLVVQQ